MENDNRFIYQYSAPTEKERAEINAIRRRYAPPNVTENKLDRLRKLDLHIKNLTNLAGIGSGVLGLLLFGLALSFILEFGLLLPGILLFLPGILLTAGACPLFYLTDRLLRRRHASEILRLTAELLGDTEQAE